MNKYIDLIGQITERLDVPYGNIRLGIHEALAYLDRYPSQAPGRTITVTASEFDEAVESCITEDATVPPHKFAERLGVVCVPDPEPTEAEKLADDLARWTGDIETCVDLGIASWLADEGWTKAPGGDDG